MVLLVPYLFSGGAELAAPSRRPAAAHPAAPDPSADGAHVLAHAALSNVKGDLPDKVPILSSATREYLKNLGM